MTTTESLSSEERAAAIGDNIARLRERISNAAVEAGRDPETVQLHGATKGVEPERILAALRHGLTQVGENWVQEAAPKIAATNALATEQGVASPTWHMIGHLQRNKVRQALELFQAIDTIDSLRLAEAVNQRAEQMNVGSVDALIEIDFTGNPDRGGFKLSLDDDGARLTGFVDDARRIIEFPQLNIIGLMTVGPMAEDAEASRPRIPPPPRTSRHAQ